MRFLIVGILSVGEQRSWHIPPAFDTIAVAYATSGNLVLTTGLKT